MADSSNFSSLIDTPTSETTDDSLSVNVYVSALTEFIKESKTPLTVAIQGEWGSGKTSFMNLVSNNLCEKKDSFFGVNIRAWEYTLLNTPRDILIGLLQGITSAIEKTVRAQQQDEALHHMFHVMRSTTIQFIKGATQAALVHAGISAAMANSLTGFAKEETSSVGELKDILKDVIKKSLHASGKKGFIFFIDDLDRLDPVIAVQFLEMLKNIFDLPDCIFVLAIDYDVVVKGLQPKFGKKTDENEREFRSFFDKIIQVPFSLPVSSYSLGKYLEKHLEEINFLKKADNPKLELGSSAQLVSGLEEDKKPQPLRDILTAVTKFSMGSNPRSIKRMLNTLSLITKIAAARNGNSNKQDQSLFTPEQKAICFCLVSLQIAYPQFYNLLTLQPDFQNEWDKDFADTRGYSTLPQDETERKNMSIPSFEEDWEEFIYRACHNKPKGRGQDQPINPYLAARWEPIVNIFTILKSVIEKNVTSENTGKEQENAVARFLGLASITGMDDAAPVSKTSERVPVATYKSLEEYLANLSGGYEVADRMIRELVGYLENSELQLKLEYREDMKIVIRPADPKKGRTKLGYIMPYSKDGKKAGGNKARLTLNNTEEEDIPFKDNLDTLQPHWATFVALYNSKSNHQAPLPA